MGDGLPCGNDYRCIGAAREEARCDLPSVGAVKLRAVVARDGERRTSNFENWRDIGLIVCFVLPEIVSKQVSIAIALIVGFAFAAFRFFFESSMPALVPTDAQGGIWIAYSLVMSGGTWVVVTVFCALALQSFGKRMRVLGVLCLLPILFIGERTVRTVIDLKEVRIALLDAENPATHPDRLRALVGYQSGFGYEVDNRIASNPSTSPETLRVLYARPNQTGTLIVLAQNPNTPDDILLALSSYDGEWRELVLNALDKNPRFREILGQVDKPSGSD